jgi:nicotinate-nucleotide adenylyltransferase
LRIGLFGGSFDPFHLGHFLIARTACEMFRLRQVVFLPCAHSPLKKIRPVARDRARLAMLRQGLKGQKWAVISDWEIQRGGVSYTVDTLRAMQKHHPRASFFWIMGSDQWVLLPSWKEPHELRRELQFLVFPRPQSPRPRGGFRMREIPLRLDISATEVRRRIQRQLPITGLVSPAVETLIRKHRWYR